VLAKTPRPPALTLRELFILLRLRSGQMRRRRQSVYCCQEIIGSQVGKPGSLHAKCIVVDNEHVLVSSANFTEAGQNRNIEVGLLIRSAVLSERLRRFFEALVDSHYFLRVI
jgi:phosphatidylserine/phosphatidylglycerophosphate/cardiolipin synthase-like enzyme